MILVAYGTRPEIIKLFPLILELRNRNIPHETLFTGQHFDLYHDVSDLVPKPDYSFERSLSNGTSQTLASSFAEICLAAEQTLSSKSFSHVIVQGDTTTAFALAITAFYNQIPVVHIEAGLRTNNLQTPYPEEANRVLISRIASFNFAPTKWAAENLKQEGLKNIHLVGNTVMDAVRIISELHQIKVPVKCEKVLVTLHRRENHVLMPLLFHQLNICALNFPQYQFVFPIHPNPNVRKHQSLLTAPNIDVTPPLGYMDLLRLISESEFLITDSGGIQEEACFFSKKVLVARTNTERPELITAGLGKLVGTEFLANIPWALEKPQFDQTNPFGDGFSASRIADALLLHSHEALTAL